MPDQSSVAELIASKRQLSAALTRQIEFQVRQMKATPDDAASQVRRNTGIQAEDQESDQITWFELASLMESEPERGTAVWQRIKNEARHELNTGMRAAETIEPKVARYPWDRAQYAAVLANLRNSLEPRTGLEDLLIQQMASVYELHLRWQEVLVRRMEEEGWQGERDKRRALENMSPAQRERYQAAEGWLPPRLAETEALEQAAMLCDRFQRAFLRLMKAFRDNRRLFGALVVAGGQVNIGDQQVNVAASARTSSSPHGDV